ncbi:hypothetical protein C8R45DRAFT_1106095 [Mycena sanguinolenta]|nr:hypothetical protein C8R45DRAFT_1106095 [Mycena sanguinolenta]
MSIVRTAPTNTHHDLFHSSPPIFVRLALRGPNPPSPSEGPFGFRTTPLSFLSVILSSLFSVSFAFLSSSAPNMRSRVALYTTGKTSSSNQHVTIFVPLTKKILYGNSNAAVPELEQNPNETKSPSTLGMPRSLVPMAKSRCTATSGSLDAAFAVVQRRYPQNSQTPSPSTLLPPSISPASSRTPHPAWPLFVFLCAVLYMLSSPLTQSSNGSMNDQDPGSFTLSCAGLPFLHFG